MFLLTRLAAQRHLQDGEIRQGNQILVREGVSNFWVCVRRDNDDTISVRGMGRFLRYPHGGTGGSLQRLADDSPEQFGNMTAAFWEVWFKWSEVDEFGRDQAPFCIPVGGHQVKRP